MSKIYHCYIFLINYVIFINKNLYVKNYKFYHQKLYYHVQVFKRWGNPRDPATKTTEHCPISCYT